MVQVPNLVWRNGVAYFRADIPLDLRGNPAFGKKREQKISLDTRDRAEARRLVLRERVKFDEQCARLRAERDAEMDLAVVQAKEHAAWVALREDPEKFEVYQAALRSRHAPKAIGD